MGYCREHLNRKKGCKKAGTAVFLAVGILMTLLGGFALYAFAVVEHGPGLVGVAAAFLLLVLPGLFCLWQAVRRMGQNRSLTDPEKSRLVQSIRRELPPEQANLPLDQVFALVDRDLEEGLHLGSVTVGQEWALIADLAVRAEHILGIFLTVHATRSGGIYVSNYEITVCNMRRECASALFLDSKKADACRDALYALAPDAVRGGNTELVNLLAMPEEALQKWNEKIMRQ